MLLSDRHLIMIVFRLKLCNIFELFRANQKKPFKPMNDINLKIIFINTISRYLNALFLFPILLLIPLFIFCSPAHATTSIPFTINLSENVTVTGMPRLQLDVGGVTRFATYVSGSGSNALSFSYSSVAGDVDLDGVTLVSPLDLNGGTIRDISGNNANLTYTLPNTSAVKINYPSLGMDFTNGTTGRYTLNGTVYNSLASFLIASGGSFSRPSIGTFFNSSGVLITASSGTPRFDYDPVTVQAKGLLIEDTRTNVVRNSNSFSTIWDIATCGGVSNTGGQR